MYIVRLAVTKELNPLNKMICMSNKRNPNKFMLRWNNETRKRASRMHQGRKL